MLQQFRAVVRQVGLTGLAVALLAQAPAQAFDLFGWKLFGSDEEEADGVIDPVPYEATLVTEGASSDLTSKLKDASLLIRRQDQPPSGLVGLIARARDDRTNLVAKLYEEARYGGIVSIVIDGRKLDDISVTDNLAAEGRKLPVTITVTPGPEFTLGHIDVGGGEKESQAAAEAGLKSGAFASTKTILAAETAVVTAWQKEGHPYAKLTSHEVVADHNTLTVDVRLNVDPGPTATLGAARVTGATTVDADFLARQADIPEGALYHPVILQRARKNLEKLDALASVSVTVAEHPDPDGSVPVLIEVSERKLRTIGVGALYSSTEGASGEVYWVHRNLFGEAETLRLEAEIGRLLEARTLDDYDARFAVLFGKPGVFDPNTRLDLKALAIQEDPDPYNRRGLVFEGALTRAFSDELTVSAGLTYDWSRIDDAFGRNYYSLFSLPVISQYDNRDSILDPTEGILARLRLEPQIETDSTATFLTTDSELRLYYALDDDKRFVLAARGVAGTIYGAEIEDIPAHRRFYAGGGGSIRGYAYLNVGPRVEPFGATGGLARVEGSLEARVKVTETIGVVPFVDAGFVAENSGFTGENDFKVGVGLGLRYYSSVGPLRFDAAVPLQPAKDDPDFAVYFGIGQAF